MEFRVGGIRKRAGKRCKGISEKAKWRHKTKEKRHKRKE